MSLTLDKPDTPKKETRNNHQSYRHVVLTRWWANKYGSTRKLVWKEEITEAVFKRKYTKSTRDKEALAPL